MFLGYIPHRIPILLLGMVNANVTKEEQKKNKALPQAYRDRVRCEALEKYGFDVRTVDKDHKVESAIEGKHVETDFCLSRTFRDAMVKEWDGIRFLAVFLDYVRSPNEWTKERWPAKSFGDALYMLLEDFVHEDGYLSLPLVDRVNVSDVAITVSSSIYICSLLCQLPSMY